MTLRAGLLAGAAGTTALNLITYVDMVARGRPSSRLPAQAAGKLTANVGIRLGEGDIADNRREALGALLGIATGIGVGGAYGILSGDWSRIPTPLAVCGLTAAAMAGSDVPLSLLKLTDPGSWGAAGWISDLLPHLGYGLVTAWVYRRLR